MSSSRVKPLMDVKDNFSRELLYTLNVEITRLY
jgi:hypothetical protein